MTSSKSSLWDKQLTVGIKAVQERRPTQGCSATGGNDDYK